MKTNEHIRFLRQVVLLGFIIGVSALSSVEGEKANGGGVYTIAVPDTVPLENITGHYYFDGQDGGYLKHDPRTTNASVILTPGGFSQTAKHTGRFNTITIPMTGGKSLEAVIFCPGYETAKIYEPFLAKSRHSASVEMKALPMLHLSGKIDSYRPVSESDAVVDISYEATLGFSHIILTDLSVPGFKVATVPLSPDGSFSADLHDFYRDPLFQQAHPEEHTMTVMVRNKKSWNILLWLSPDPKNESGAFPIQRSYPDVVTFHASKEPSR